MHQKNKMSAIGVLFIAFLLSGFEVFLFDTVSAFMPNTHILTGNSAIDLIMKESDTVIINGRPYPVDNRIADAIKSYPDYYRGGLVGPDTFPDIYVGQSFIHPDTRCDNGLKKGNECNNNPGFSFTYEWLRHVYDSAWNYYNIRNGDDEAKKALAFAYGFLTHAAGDIWGHTLVNSFTDDAFLGPRKMVEDPAKLSDATTHIIVESYIGEHTPDTNLSIDSPNDFIYRTLIDSSFVDSKGQTSESLGRGQIFNYFFELRNRLIQKSADLRNEEEDLNRRAQACTLWDFSCSHIIILSKKQVVEQMNAYVDEWIKDVDSGLHAWPQMSQDVSYNLFSNMQEDHIDKAIEVIEGFVGDHLIAMLGAPNSVGSAYNLIDNINDFLIELLGEVDWPIKDYFRNYIILQITGINIPSLKELYSNPTNYINTPGSVTIGGQTVDIGLPVNTSQKLDKLMGIENGEHNPSIKFDIERFAAAKNTITLAKLLLLSPETLNQLLKDHGSVPIYQGKDNGYGQSNAMLDFVRSIDANHQWRMNSIRTGDVRPDGSPRQHSEGMPLWMSCLARDRVFRVLFIDWENVNFPDLGEGCLPETKISVS